MNSYEIYVGGEFIKTDKTLSVSNPFNNEIFAETYLGNEQVLEKAIVKAQSVEKEMKELPAYQRYEILMQVSKEITENKEYLAKVLSMESGKPLIYANIEIERAAQVFLVAAEESKRLPKEYISLDWLPSGKNKEGIIKYFPVGLVAGISPFNFPMMLAAHKIAPAIAAGCPIILKPASSTPLSTIEMARIIDKTSLPKGAFSVIPMSREAGNKLVTDERFKLLTFTGSPEVGWKMKRDAGKKKVVLELGGNAGVIIAASADIDYAVKRCLVGAFSYSGQVCIHTQRIFIEHKIINTFVEKFVEATKLLKYGDSLAPDTQISAMIDEQNAIRVKTWVDEAVNEGAKVLCGGNRQGTYFEPTIITNIKNSMKVCCQEVFGPVVTIEPFDDFTDAVERLNNTDFGLQAGVFTSQVDQMNYAFNNIETGGVMHNDIPTFRMDHMPYGGIKDSGLGREGVKYAIFDMMEPKILVKDAL